MQNNDSIPNQANLSPGGRQNAKNDDGGSDSGGQSYEDRNGQHHPIAEFLYQLTKMLTDDNSEIIEWSDGRIKVHYPERLEGEVLHKYFRHSKFASFQRQLNYFGFRKIAGKGKMSPCSYVNEGATSDIRSLLLIKRKTNGSAARKAALQQRAAALVTSASGAQNGLAGLSFPGMNLSANMFDGHQALSNAMALLSENALRAGIGQIPLSSQQHQQGAAAQQLNLLALQHQHQRLQKQLIEQQNLQAQQNQAALNKLQAEQKGGFMDSNKASVSFAANLFKPDNLSQRSDNNGSNPSLEQLHAHLKALGQQQQQSSSSNFAAHLLGQAAAHQAGSPSALNRATAALNAQSMPATAAMDAAASTQTSTNNLFESAINLKSLLDEHKAHSEQAAAQQNAATQALFNRLPSQAGLFPGDNNMSTLSFGNLLGSSNRLSSLLSLNSFLGSREASMADFAAAMPANVRDQLAAGVAAANAHQFSAAAHDAAKYRANNP
jgi:HSF-type DNA-binding